MSMSKRDDHWRRQKFVVGYRHFHTVQLMNIQKYTKNKIMKWIKIKFFYLYLVIACIFFDIAKIPIGTSSFLKFTVESRIRKQNFLFKAQQFINWYFKFYTDSVCKKSNNFFFDLGQVSNPDFWNNLVAEWPKVS